MPHRLFALILAVAILTPAIADAERPPQIATPAHYTAFAVSAGGPRTSSVATAVDITINRWSTSGESERLLTTLKEKGPEKLLDALQDAKSVGTIRTPGNLAYDLRFAYAEPGEDGGTRVFLVTDRPVSFWEAVNRPRLSDYPFTFIELRLNKNGEGVGKLSLATKLTVSRDGRMVELENYDAQPIALNEVRLKR
jgi:hypothetical protein